jgi:hypothetical protein
MLTTSRTDSVDPRRAMPNTENVEPKRIKDRKDRDEAK